MIKFLDLTPSPKLRTELDAAYNRVMSSGRYIGGDEVAAFEHEWADYLGAQYAVGCGSGFDALQLILRAHRTRLDDIAVDDAVLVPAHTCLPTWLAVVAAGCRPIGYDDIEDIPRIMEGCYTIIAIIAVHLYGIPADIDRIQKLKRRPTVRVIEDAAQAHGSIYKGRKCGTLADAAAFSFYPTKNLGCYGDSGAVVTNDLTLAERVREMANYGCRGAINSRLDPLQAAFLRVKLEWLDRWNERRSKNAYAYHLELTKFGRPVSPLYWWDNDCNFHQYVVECGHSSQSTPKTTRGYMHDILRDKGIETMIHYPAPPHLMANFGYQRGDFPKAERWADTVLSLPIGPHLGEDDIMQVVEAIKGFEQC